MLTRLFLIFTRPSRRDPAPSGGRETRLRARQDQNHSFISPADKTRWFFEEEPAPIPESDSSLSLVFEGKSGGGDTWDDLYPTGPDDGESSAALAARQAGYSAAARKRALILRRPKRLHVRLPHALSLAETDPATLRFNAVSVSDKAPVLTRMLAPLRRVASGRGSSAPFEAAIIINALHDVLAWREGLANSVAGLEDQVLREKLLATPSAITFAEDRIDGILDNFLHMHEGSSPAATAENYEIKALLNMVLLYCQTLQDCMAIDRAVNHFVDKTETKQRELEQMTELAPRAQEFAVQAGGLKSEWEDLKRDADMEGFDLVRTTLRKFDKKLDAAMREFERFAHPLKKKKKPGKTEEPVLQLLETGSLVP